MVQNFSQVTVGEHRVVNVVVNVFVCTAELLHINDQLNNVALRYERFERMRTGGAAPQSQAESPYPPQPSSVSCTYAFAFILLIWFSVELLSVLED